MLRMLNAQLMISKIIYLFAAHSEVGESRGVLWCQSPTGRGCVRGRCHSSRPPPPGAGGGWRGRPGPVSLPCLLPRTALVFSPCLPTVYWPPQVRPSCPTFSHFPASTANSFYRISLLSLFLHTLYSTLYQVFQGQKEVSKVYKAVTSINGFGVNIYQGWAGSR